MTEKVKTCSRCKKTKSLSRFHKIKGSRVKDGRFTYCRLCAREYKKTYYRVRNADQKLKAKLRKWTREGMPTPTRPMPAVCECCGGPSTRALHLDHCHETGEFRGWLCYACNRGLGFFKDNLAGLLLAVWYLACNEKIEHEKS